LPPPSPERAPARLATRPARALLLGAVLLVAACGFAYELVVVALGAYLFGSGVEQTSFVLAAFVSSMGLGSLLAKPLLRAPLAGFCLLEAALGLLGGLSALLLYGSFAYLGLELPALLGVAGAVGVLVGAEIPLLVALLQRLRAEAAGTSIADLLAADYLGAVVAGVAFPLALLPALGHVEAALALGALNVAAGGLVLWLLGAAERTRGALAGTLAAALAALGAVALLADDLVVSARQALYDDPIVAEVRSPVQDVVLTAGGGDDVRLFLDGDLQFSSRDEHRYHEALVHPAMAGRHGSVLVLGGGDGLALREVLRYPGVRRAVLVDLDPAVTELARTDPRLRELNRRAFQDPRVEVVHGDAFAWLRRGGAGRFDVVLADFPDPDGAATAKLYAVELYGLVRAAALAPGGRLAVQAGSPWFARSAFWSVDASVRAAGFATRPYHVDVPSFGDWGFVLAALGDRPPRLRVAPPGPLRSLDAPTLAAAATFPPDRRRPPGIQPSTLDRPRVADYQREALEGY